MATPTHIRIQGDPTPIAKLKGATISHAGQSHVVGEGQLPEWATDPLKWLQVADMQPQEPPKPKREYTDADFRNVAADELRKKLPVGQTFVSDCGKKKYTVGQRGRVPAWMCEIYLKMQMDIDNAIPD